MGPPSSPPTVHFRNVVFIMQEGQFIKMEYDAFVKETGQLIDTTHEDVAKENDSFNERARYEPIPIIVGSGHVIKGLDTDLLNAEVGVERELEVPARDAYGERDPKLVEVYPMQKVLSLPEFRKGDRYPTEGMDVHINNRAGTISRIFTGRVYVDFNNRWAGRNLLYKYKVTEVIEDREARIKAIIESVFGRAEEFVINEHDDEKVEVLLPDIVKLDSSWTMAKFRIVSELRNHLGVKTVRFIEEYIKKEAPEHDHDHEHDHEHGHDHGSLDDKAEEAPDEGQNADEASAVNDVE